MSKYNNPHLNVLFAAKTSLSLKSNYVTFLHILSTTKAFSQIKEFIRSPLLPLYPLEHTDILVDLQIGKLARKKKRICHRNIITGVSVRPPVEKEHENIYIPLLGFALGPSFTRIRVTSIPQSVAQFVC
jgi:hypothetical protein